jgi:hypothetical protein
MSTMKISRLLKKYYDGVSSAEEELILRNYFGGKNISEEFATEREIFRHYNRFALVPEPSDDFEDRIISALDSEDSKGGFFSFNRRRIIAFSGVAAGFLLLIGSYFLFNSGNVTKDTFTNPELAYNETVKILYNISAQLNRGTNQLNNIRKIEDTAVKSLETINRSTMIIDKNLKNLDYFQQAFSIISSPMDYVKNK